MADRETMQCTICLSTMLKKRYKAHMRDVHSDFERPKNIICEICGLGFPSTRSLKNHSKCHIMDEKLVCKVCGIDTFITKEMMKKILKSVIQILYRL